MILINCSIGKGLGACSVKIDNDRKAVVQLHQDGYIVGTICKMGYPQTASITISKEAFESLYTAMKDARKRRKLFDRADHLKAIFISYVWSLRHEEGGEAT